MNLTCYIVDDELHAINVLKDYIAKTPGLVLAGHSTEPLTALAEVSVPDPPDVVFVDVDMPELNGLNFAGLVNTFTTVIFTTAYREYGADAFEKRAADYLVKPIFYERFLASVLKVNRKEMRDFFVRTGTKGKMERVVTADIIHIQGADAYITILSKNNKLMTYMSVGEVLKRLPSDRFSRIHRSHIIQDDLVRIIEPGQVTLENGLVLPIGPLYKEEFFNKMDYR